MRSIKFIGAAAIAALALSVVGTAAASAHEFFFSGSVPTELIVKANSTQTLTASFGSVECTEVKATSGNTFIKSVKTTAQEVTVEYTKCKATIFGFPTSVKEPIVSSYELLASEAVTKVHSVIETGACTLTVTGGPYKEVKYVNKGTELEVNAKLTGMSYTSNSCGSGSNATYTGKALARGASGGTLSWA